jgi:hypothetical protein
MFLAQSSSNQSALATGISYANTASWQSPIAPATTSPWATSGWDRRGNHELKNLSYHAWRTACKSTTGPNAIKMFYQQSRFRTGSVRHARLNTQRKILETMWMIWLRHRPFDPERFARKQIAAGEQGTVTTRARLRERQAEAKKKSRWHEDLPG